MRSVPFRRDGSVLLRGTGSERQLFEPLGSADGTRKRPPYCVSSGVSRISKWSERSSKRASTSRACLGT
jgi:hypothetical protein